MGKARKKSKAQTIRQDKQQRKAEEDDLESEGEEPLPMRPPGMLPPNLLLAMLPPYIVPPMLPHIVPLASSSPGCRGRRRSACLMCDEGWKSICWQGLWHALHPAADRRACHLHPVPCRVRVSFSQQRCATLKHQSKGARPSTSGGQDFSSYSLR